MLFNSFQFLLFFPVVTLLFFLLPHAYRWILLLAASCYFYMAFVPIYILILFSTIIVDYFAGIYIENSEGKKRKWYLGFTVAINILILCVFKYYNFFVSGTNIFIHSVGYREFSFPILNMLLPIGLSFHTFQALSYIFEINRGNIKAERNFGIYSLYVMFYPQLVAGPIERPQNMLPQFYERKTFDVSRVLSGLKIMLWGFIKKVVIADRLAIFVNDVFASPAETGSINVWLAVILFLPFQVYCDFSGYSSIAIGAAKVMGFQLMENFKSPFQSLTTSELWNRWHISLSTWFRDYLYQPLVIYFRDYGKWAVVIGLMVTFFLSGFWHGAGLSFIVYGLVQGTVIVVEFLRGVKSTKLAKTAAGRIKGIILTYFFFAFSLIFFRSGGIRKAVTIIKNMFINFDGRFMALPQVTLFTFLVSVLSILGLIIFENRNGNKLINETYQGSKEVTIFFIMIILLFTLGVFHNVSFIYFQF